MPGMLHAQLRKIDNVEKLISCFAIVDHLADVHGANKNISCGEARSPDDVQAEVSKHGVFALLENLGKVFRNPQEIKVAINLH